MPKYRSESVESSNSYYKDMLSLNLPSNISTQLSEAVSEPIEVYLRIRSRTTDEVINQVATFPYSVDDDKYLHLEASRNVNSTLGQYNHRYQFSNIFDCNSTQEDVYRRVANPIVQDFINGNNRLLFNYGVTNSGKTFTMQGSLSQPGIIPRSLDHLFQNIGHQICATPNFKPQDGSLIKLSVQDAARETKFKNSIMKMDFTSTSMSLGSTFSSSRMVSDLDDSHSTLNQLESTQSSESQLCNGSSCSKESRGQSSTYYLWVSFVEIYSEQIFDLLSALTNRTQRTLKLRETENGVAFLQGVTEVCVSTPDEAYKLLLLGQQALRQASTKLNHSSSRSHCLFTLKLIRLAGDDNSTPEMHEMSFCDLAGSERCSKTQNAGERLREAGVINTSLMVLGRCIFQLRRNKTLSQENASMVPFRDSKLTKMLKTFLTGYGKASMLINISPCVDMFDESLHVLKFSAMARQLTLPLYQSFLKSNRVTRSSLNSLRQSLVDSRGSIPWEDTELVSTTTDQIENEQESKVTISEDADGTETPEQLREMIDLLKQHIVRLTEEKLTQEIELREELCTAFAAQLKETEDYYRDRIAEEQEEAQEMMSRRLEILAEYYRSKKCEACKEQGKQEDGKSEAVVDTTQRLSIDSELDVVMESEPQLLNTSKDNLAEENVELIKQLNATKDELEQSEKEKAELKQQLKDMKLAIEMKTIPTTLDVEVETDSIARSSYGVQTSFHEAEATDAIDEQCSNEENKSNQMLKSRQSLYHSLSAASSESHDDDDFKVPQPPETTTFNGCQDSSSSDKSNKKSTDRRSMYYSVIATSSESSDEDLNAAEHKAVNSESDFISSPTSNGPSVDVEKNPKQVSEITEYVKNTYSAVNELQKQICSLQSEINERFETQTTKLDYLQIKSHKADQAQNTSPLDNRILSAEKVLVEQLKNRNSEMEEEMTDLKAEVRRLEGTVENLTKEKELSKKQELKAESVQEEVPKTIKKRQRNVKIVDKEVDQNTNGGELSSEGSGSSPLIHSKRKRKVVASVKKVAQSERKPTITFEDSDDAFESPPKPKTARKQLHRVNKAETVLSPVKSPINKAKPDVHQKVLRKLRQRK